MKLFRRVVMGPRHAFVAIVAVGGIVATLAPGAGADTASDIRAAKARLATLESQIMGTEQAVANLQQQVRSAATQLAQAEQAFETTLAQVESTTADLNATRAYYRAIRARLDERAAAVYIEGGNLPFESVLEATSLSDLTDRLEYVNSLSRGDGVLAGQANDFAVQLLRKQVGLNALRTEQAGLVATLGSERQALTQDLSDQLAALSNLAGAREEAAALVTRLQKKLQAEELAAARALLLGGTPVTYGQWASLFLPRLGAPICQNNLTLVVAWETIEGTQARFNPLDTTYPMPGATDFNWVGVKNYVSLLQGLQATVDTLLLPNPALGYGPIVADLRGCAASMTTGQAINMSMYCPCTGSYGIIQVIPLVGADYSRYASIRTGG